MATGVGVPVMVGVAVFVGVGVAVSVGVFVTVGVFVGVGIKPTVTKVLVLIKPMRQFMESPIGVQILPLELKVTGQLLVSFIHSLAGT